MTEHTNSYNYGLPYTDQDDRRILETFSIPSQERDLSSLSAELNRSIGALRQRYFNIKPRDVNKETASITPIDRKLDKPIPNLRIQLQQENEQLKKELAEANSKLICYDKVIEIKDKKIILVLPYNTLAELNEHLNNLSAIDVVKKFMGEVL